MIVILYSGELSKAKLLSTDIINQFIEQRTIFVYPKTVWNYED